MVIEMKVSSSTYTALAGMQKGMNSARKHTAELSGATQMSEHVEKANAKSTHSTNEVIGTIIDVKA